jgi:hypothetical protein
MAGRAVIAALLAARPGAIHAAAVGPSAACVPGRARARGLAAAADAFGDLSRMPQRRVVVTGLGVVCPVGVGAAASWAALVAGRTGTRALQLEDLPEVRRGPARARPAAAAAPRHAMPWAGRVQACPGPFESRPWGARRLDATPARTGAAAPSRRSPSAAPLSPCRRA